MSTLLNYQSFDVIVTNHIAHIAFSRPEALNTMNQDFWAELPQCINAIETHTDARVIVVSSTGRHFTAGMDLSVFADAGTLPTQGEPGRLAENLRRLVLQLQGSLSSLEQARIPVLAAIQGGCIGGGLDLVCAADMRYCTEDAFFTIKETEIGMTADVGTLQRMPKLMPEGVVRELAYTGRRLHAKEAQQLGFVNQVFANHEALLEGVMAIAKQIAQHSPLAVVGCKAMLNYSRDHTVADSLNYMATWQAGMFRIEEIMQTMQAQQQQKQPQYDDLLPLTPLFNRS